MDNVKHFLKVEIELTTQRLNADDGNPFYDGVNVGYLNSVDLLQKHIWFCRHLLKLIEKENHNEHNSM